MWRYGNNHCERTRAHYVKNYVGIHEWKISSSIKSWNARGLRREEIKETGTENLFIKASVYRYTNFEILSWFHHQLCSFASSIDWFRKASWMKCRLESMENWNFHYYKLQEGKIENWLIDINKSNEMSPPERPANRAR